jgi:hypothetical protein
MPYLATLACMIFAWLIGVFVVLRTGRVAVPPGERAFHVIPVTPC